MFAPTTLRGYSKFLKKILDPRSASLVFQQGYSQEVEDIFKFYSDEQPTCDHRPLTEDDYERFISRRAARREPALTRQISKSVIY